jgi:hypothetical protein
MGGGSSVLISSLARLSYCAASYLASSRSRGARITLKWLHHYYLLLQVDRFVLAAWLNHRAIVLIAS